MSITIQLGADQSEVYIQVPAAYGVQSDYSTGALSLGQLVELAAGKGIKAIIMGDHLRIAFKYGFPPFRRLFRIKKENPSVFTHGVRNYLNDIRRINGAQDRVVVIPGLELLTHYYWTGSPFKSNLTLHNTKMDMHVIGLPEDSNYKHLPVIDGSLSTRYTLQLLPGTLVFTTAFGLGIYLLTRKRINRALGYAVVFISILGMINNHPFRSSLFDAYHGDQSTEPYQVVIDYVKEQGGIISWSAPEVNTSKRKIDCVTVQGTPPHPEVLVETCGYTAFEVLYGDNRSAHLPSNTWDEVLQNYCRGVLEKPVWGLGSIDFHKTSEGRWFQIDGAQTVFLCRDISTESILEAFKKGRMYAVFQGGTSWIRLDRFTVEAAGGGQAALQGEEIRAQGKVKIVIRLSIDDKSKQKINIRLIKSGRLIEELRGETPFYREYVDDISRDEGKIYYRLMARASKYEIISNPVFVNMEKNEQERL